MYSLQEITSICGGKIAGGNNYSVDVFLTDSRALINASGVLFIAVKTKKNNGHNYIRQLAEKGVCSFLIQENEFDISLIKDSPVTFVLVPDTLKALQALARHHRQQFKIPVIGITGSNGKTVVKEWLYQLLKNNYSICRSPKSYNSQIGVPLSVLNLNASHNLAIFEAGISEAGEMDALAGIIQPTLGIITSIGSAHDEGFKNREQKISEKLKLVKHCEKIILNGLNKEQVPDELKNKSLLLSEENGTDIKISFDNNLLELKSAGETLSFKLPFSDKASILNASTCIAALMHFQLLPENLEERLALLQPVALRLEIRNGIHNSLIINDFYNSDLDSLKIALNFLQQQSRHPKKALIISDIEQSGIPDNRLYNEIAKLISAHQIDLIIGIGKKISGFRTFFRSDAVFFESTFDFVKHFSNISYRFGDSTVLLKGARSFGFENIGNLLQQKSHDTIFEINLNKLISNINYYKLQLKPGVQLMCMVKAMGYGGGSSELAKTLQHAGVNYLAVAYADEGVELRQARIQLPVMVMSPETDAFEDIINYRLEPEIYSLRVLEMFTRKLDQLGATEAYPIHLKIDTGMRRLGFEENEVEELINHLKKFTQVKVQSVFSHLAASDNSQLDDFTETQISTFEKVCRQIKDGIGYSFIKHICNSGAITRFKHAHYDMVRLGIGMHGVGVNAEEQKQLENVGALKTRISQIKKIKAGESVGYNRSGKAEKDIIIATIPIGYADGFSRALGNGKYGVYIGNSFCKTVGNICMDMCMVDVSEANCAEGDEAVVFENIDQLRKMAEAMGTISYEVLTSVSGRVKRVYVQE